MLTKEEKIQIIESHKRNLDYTRYNLDVESNSLREDILHNIQELFGVNRFNYIYGTDGDTIISDKNLMYLLDTMKRRDATACCGIVNVNEDYGKLFWNWMQNFQYLYGQFMRRTNEDLFNQELCLPGCIQCIRFNRNVQRQ